MRLINSILKLLITIFFAFLFLFRGKPRFSEDLKRTIALYKDDGFGRLFATIRSWDAPYDQMEKLIPKRGTILDIGSGDGLFANFLAISSPKRNVVGVDLRKQRVMAGEKGVPNVRFIVGDAINTKLPKADSVVMFHLLHHIYPKMKQREIIQKVANLLSKNGKFVVVEIAQRPILKYIFCFLVDAFVLPVLFDRKLYDFDFHYRKPVEWEEILSENGFTSTRKFVDRGMPFPHVIINATKKA